MAATLRILHQSLSQADIYGSEPIPWTRAREALAGSRGPGAFFPGTVGPDATPHAAGIGAVWADGTL